MKSLGGATCYAPGMPPSGAERWFHTLVVVGAALGGCGGKTIEEGHTVTGATGGATGGSNTGGGGGSSTSTSGGIGPEACEADAQFACQDYATRRRCQCDVTRPLNMSDCYNPLDYVCTELPCLDNEPCTQHFVNCSCGRASLRPKVCEAPEQFFCETTYPFFRDCACRPGPPVDPATCPKSYCCQSNDPRFGCDCSCIPIK